jgi:hypothetical protein
MAKMYSIICTRNMQAPTAKILKQSLLKKGVQDVYFIENSFSIFDGYRGAAQHLSKQFSNDDVLIFHHDDIEILEACNFEQAFEPLKRPDTGFIGVAGTRRFTATGAWWSPEISEAESLPYLSGRVYHRLNDTIQMNQYGPVGQVMALDGVLLACTWAAFQAVDPFYRPNRFFGPWDYYDINACFRMHAAGRKNYTAELPIVHLSEGSIEGRMGWKHNRAALLTEFASQLPLQCGH